MVNPNDPTHRDLLKKGLKFVANVHADQLTEIAMDIRVSILGRWKVDGSPRAYFLEDGELKLCRDYASLWALPYNAEELNEEEIQSTLDSLCNHSILRNYRIRRPKRKKQ